MFLTLTLSRELLRRTVEGVRYDIRTFLEGVPFKMTSGNPSYAIKVEIDEKDIEALHKALDGRCTISTITELRRP